MTESLGLGPACWSLACGCEQNTTNRTGLGGDSGMGLHRRPLKLGKVGKLSRGTSSWRSATRGLLDTFPLGTTRPTRLSLPNQWLATTLSYSLSPLFLPVSPACSLFLPLCPSPSRSLALLFLLPLPPALPLPLSPSPLDITAATSGHNPKK